MSNAPQVEVWPIERLRPYENNARKIEQIAVEKVAHSIKRYGFNNPILANAEGVIIAGHTRLQAAKSLDLAEVPVIVCELGKEREMAFRLADNRTAQETQWDYDLLRTELMELDEVLNVDLIDTGFDPSELAHILEGPSGLDDEEQEADAGQDDDSEKPDFALTIAFKDEHEQMAAYAKLVNEGYNVTPA